MKTANYSIQLIRWIDAIDQLKAVRTQVFVQEQNVPESLEWDGLDEQAIHVLATDSRGQAVATARMLSDGHIGRMAVLKDYRHRGIGHQMLTLLLRTAQNKGYPSVFLHAQRSAVGFYEKHGFQSSGKPFMEAGIDHQCMVLGLETVN